MPSPLGTGTLNPRVLSDMGLAIPRPTRLGDPRSVETEAEFKSAGLGVRLTLKHNINVAAIFVGLTVKEQLQQLQESL